MTGTGAATLGLALIFQGVFTNYLGIPSTSDSAAWLLVIREPELLVGTSAGAINAAFLGARGVSTRALDALDEAWCTAAGMDLLPSNYVWLTLRSVLRRSSTSPASRIREFFIANGVTPELRFADLPGPRVVMVSSDLNTGQPVLHGTEPGDSVLDALLLSTALPPWFMPVKRQGH